jgi:hypothetical protein
MLQITQIDPPQYRRRGMFFSTGVRKAMPERRLEHDLWPAIADAALNGKLDQLDLFRPTWIQQVSRLLVFCDIL